MSDNNNENANSQNGNNTEEEIILPKEGEEEDTDDVEVLKERLKQRNEAAAQLFARAKKAEGFELKEGQWVKKAQKAPETKPEATQKTVRKEEDVAKLVAEALDQRDLESTDLSDDLKKAVSDLSKMKGISIKKAIADPYIQFLKEQEGRTDKAENGSMPTGRKGTSNESTKVEIGDVKDKESRKAVIDQIQKKKDDIRKQLG